MKSKPRPDRKPKPRPSIGSAIYCRDCGEPGELTGHMGCQYPGLRSEGAR